MSGVRVLITDSDCTSSDGSTSRATARRALSGGGHQGAVDGYAVEVRTEATHADKSPFALIALDADAGQTLHRFCDVFIRQLGQRRRHAPRF